MKTLFSIVIVCILQLNSFSQDKDIDARAASIPEASSASADALASYIKENFVSDADRIRAIYVWIANHINYDVPRLLARDDNANTPPQTVSDVLATRSAVCQGYADLFIALCKGVGVNAMTISGYTKLQGKIAPLSHAWATASLDGEWYFFDPTWGAGHVRDEKFIKRFNNAFYKASPVNFIADHMPFDPMYQFLPSPITNKEFIEGKPVNNKVLFNYKDSLKQYVQLTSIQQNAAELRRLQAAGIENDLLRKRQFYLQNRLQSFASKNSFDEGNTIFRKVMESYKEYIAHKNKQFTTIGDNDLRNIIDSIEVNVKLSRSLLSQAIPKTDAQAQAKANNAGNIDRFWMQFVNEQQFVAKYFSTDKAARKELFRRR